VQDFGYLRSFIVSILSLLSVDGWIEVLSPDTAIVRIIPQSGDEDEDREDFLMMRLFLDFVTTEALKNKTLQPYTREISEAASLLIEGVELDDEQENA
jgi:antitoxin PrlF